MSTLGRSAVGVRSAENLDVFVERNDPSPALQADSCCTGLAIGALEGPFGLGGSCENAFARENGRRFALLWLPSAGFAVRGASSTSDFETSTGGELSRGFFSSPDVGMEFDRWAHRSRTPSTALKKLVEPTFNVRATASRAGASC